MNSIFLLIGLGFLILGAELIIRGSVSFGKKLKVSLFAIGVVIVAGGTSLPELAVTVIAALRGHKGVAIGNVLGSNVINILGILGVTSIYAGGIAISGDFAGRDIWVVMITSGLVAAMLLDNRRIGKRVGLVMVIGYLLYMIFLYSS